MEPYVEPFRVFTHPYQECTESWAACKLLPYAAIKHGKLPGDPYFCGYMGPTRTIGSTEVGFISGSVACGYPEHLHAMKAGGEMKECNSTLNRCGRCGESIPSVNVDQEFCGWYSGSIDWAKSRE